MKDLVRFSLDGQQYALKLQTVMHVVHIVEITPLPKAPEIVTGIINYQGSIIAVYDIRKRLGLPERRTLLYDHLIVAKTKQHLVGLVVDDVVGVLHINESSVIPPASIHEDIEYVDGIVKQEDGLILIHDLDRFLSSTEEEELTEALQQLSKGELCRS